MAANLFGRYVWLMDILLRYKRLTFEEIDKLWQESGLSYGEELSLKTFITIKKAIKDIFYHLKPTFDFYQLVLAQGDQLEVLEPESVRDEMRNFAQNMLNYYTEKKEDKPCKE